MCKYYFTSAGWSPIINEKIISEVTVGCLLLPAVPLEQLRKTVWLTFYSSHEDPYFSLSTNFDIAQRYSPKMPGIEANSRQVFLPKHISQIQSLWCPRCLSGSIEHLKLDAWMGLFKLGGMQAICDFLISTDFIYQPPLIDTTNFEFNKFLNV